jgi:peptidoglycan/LPS O-acetylase OafA/YrhL
MQGADPLATAMSPARTEQAADFTRTHDPALRQRRNNFDLLRLLAAAQVIYVHCVVFLDIEARGLLGTVNHVAAVFPGVPIFFVISGFLVSQSFENSANVRDYFHRRALRIFPALWACFAVTLLLLGTFVLVERLTDRDFTAVGDGFFWSWTFPVWVISQVTVGQFFEPAVPFGVGNTNPSLWTIPIEIAFYVCVPLIYLLIRALGRSMSSAVLVGAAILSFLAWYVGRFTIGGSAGRDELSSIVIPPPGVRMLEQTPLPFLYWFILGVLIWRYFEVVGTYMRDRLLLWTAAYVLLCYAPMWFGAEWVQSTPAYQLARALGLAMWAMSFALSFRGVSHRLLRGLDLSFGLYLYHMLIINSLVELHLGGSIGSILFTYLATGVLAFLSWKLVERPALKRRRLLGASWSVSSLRRRLAASP